ncbi:MAG TPA: hypothetical protein VHR18_12535 [Solirubrobacterales bacterium]|nr:hypothetical protein [Solirubrobacterales bacterium]
MKKLTLLAMAVGALVALAVPAAASANLMWDKAGEIHIEGELSTQNAGPTLINGPCPVTFEGSAANIGGVAGGQIESGEGGPCGTNFGFCEIEKVELGALPWELTTSTPDFVTIHGATFTNYYSAGCAAISLPAKVSATGTVTGTVHLEDEEQCITFTNAEGLTLEANNAPLTLNGEVCITKGGPRLT